MSEIFDSHTESYARKQYSQRGTDGQWFSRFQYRGPYGYRWSKWARCPSPDPQRVWKSRGEGRSRLPKEV